MTTLVTSNVTIRVTRDGAGRDGTGDINPLRREERRAERRAVEADPWRGGRAPIPSKCPSCRLAVSALLSRRRRWPRVDIGVDIGGVPSVAPAGLSVVSSVRGSSGQVSR